MIRIDESMHFDMTDGAPLVCGVCSVEQPIGQTAKDPLMYAWDLNDLSTVECDGCRETREGVAPGGRGNTVGGEPAMRQCVHEETRQFECLCVECFDPYGYNPDGSRTAYPDCEGCGGCGVVHQFKGEQEDVWHAGPLPVHKRDHAADAMGWD